MIYQRAIDHNLISCHICGLVAQRQAVDHQHCPLCHSPLHQRKVDSVARTWALLITAMLMYLPANLLPVMKTTFFGSTSADTIMGGVIYFMQHGDWPLALIIFVASIVVPLFKMVALIYLLICVQRRSAIRLRERTLLYRITEVIGRWSMVDVFVVALMTALVHSGNLLTIQPGAGALAFALVVILTMLAAMSFDPRLIWDNQEHLSGKEL